MTTKTHERTSKARKPAGSRRLTWRRLLLWMGIANAVLLLAFGLVAGDREALAYGGLVTAGVALLALRGGLAGIVMVGVLAANTAAWMVPAAALNIGSREAMLDAMIPASLAVISVTGATAAAASIAFRRDPDADGRAVRIVVQVAIAVLVLAAGAVAAQPTEDAAAPADRVIELRSASYAPASLALDSGQVTIAVANRDLFWHTLTIDELGIDVGLPGRADRRVTLDARPGTYRYYCAVPGHRLLGMEGTLTVR